MPSLGATTSEIDALVARLANGENPARDRLEETLTDGYAWALQLDAECGRLERRISAKTEGLAEEPSEEQARELSTLARLLLRRRGELDSLRERLAALTAGAREARAA